MKGIIASTASEARQQGKDWIGMSVVWLNGRLVPEGEAAISIFDRGFTLADGVFETLRVREGRPLWLTDHLARLHTGAEVFGIPVPFDDGVLAAGIGELLAALGLAQASLRLTLTRGPSRVRGLWPPASPATPTVLMTANALPAGAPRPPMNLVVARTVRRNEHSPLSRIKSLNYGDNILARREAEARGADDCLLMNGAGRIVCATAGNVFVLWDGVWRTPPIAEGILAGTARSRLIGMLEAREEPLEASAASEAEAGFVSNSLGLYAIGRIEGRALEDIGDLLAALPLYEIA
jgi:branched-chain amino acid aminotransferase